MSISMAIRVSQNFTCKTSRIDHGTLSLLLGKMRLSGHLVEVVAHGSHLLLALHLGPADRLVGASLVAERLVGVGQLLLNLVLGSD